VVILGLGSNIGDRLANLRASLRAINDLPEMHVLQVSPVYISDAMLPENAPTDWDLPYLNAAIRCETTLSPPDLLQKLKAIESSIGRKPLKRHWGPRAIDIDILAWDDLKLESETLTIPHKNLQERPFALWPLADVAPFWLYEGKTAAQLVEKWPSRFSDDAPFHTRQINHRIDTPQLVGVINITPDSFSDGGHFLAIHHAVQQAHALILAGADVLDIGAESTAPSAAPIDANTEWQRLQPVLTAIMAQKNNFFMPVKISVDTRYASTAQKVLALGVDWINDVTGLDDLAMRELIAQTNTDCVVMHHLAIPEDRSQVLPRNQNVVKIVYEWAEQRLETLEKFGIKREKIIFDPGIGFGKHAEQSLDLIKNCRIFSSLNVRILMGHSRKSLFSILSPVKAAERDIETQAMTSFLAEQPVDYLRLHNVDAAARTLRIISALKE